MKQECPVVLLGKENQDELKALCRDPHVFSMVADLLALGETYATIKSASNFEILNNRYTALSGKTCRRIGSVKDAILAIYPKD